MNQSCPTNSTNASTILSPTPQNTPSNEDLCDSPGDVPPPTEHHHHDIDEDDLTDSLELDELEAQKDAEMDSEPLSDRELFEDDGDCVSDDSVSEDALSSVDHLAENNEETTSNPDYVIQYSLFWQKLQNEKPHIPEKLTNTFSSDSSLTILFLYMRLLENMLKHRSANSSVEDEMQLFKDSHPKSKIARNFSTLKNYLEQMGLKMEIFFVDEAEGTFFLSKPPQIETKEVHYFPITRVLNLINEYGSFENIVFHSFEEFL